MRKKQIRIKTLFEFENIIFTEDNFQIPHNKKIILELGCGSGEFLNHLAMENKQFFFIGIDIKKDRLWQACDEVKKRNILNAHYIFGKLPDTLKIFTCQSIDEIWIRFPLPHTKPSKSNKRFTHSIFIKEYKKILKIDGKIHIMTDSDHFYDFSKKEFELFQELQKITDIDKILYDQSSNRLSKFESMWLEKKRNIKYLQYQLV